MIVGFAAQSNSYGISKGNMAVAVRVDATYESSDGKIRLDFLLGGQLDMLTRKLQTCRIFQDMNIYINRDITQFDCNVK